MRQVGFGAAATLALLIAAPEGAQAGTYVVVSCTSAPGYVNNAWVHSPTSSKQADCPPGAGIEAYASAGACAETRAVKWVVAPARAVMPAAAACTVLPGGTSKWIFTAPQSTTLQSFAGSWRCYRTTTALASWSLSSPSGASGSGTCTSSGFTSVTRTLNSGATALQLIATFDSCHVSDPGCKGNYVRAALSASRMTVRDDVLPSPTMTGGTLLSGGWKRGTHSVVYDASDNTGIKSASLVVDGVVSATQGHSCDYTRPKPCANVTGATFTLDTTQLSDGPHSVALRTTDAASNVAQSAAVDIKTDNTVPGFELEGSLFESAHEPLTGEDYELNIDADDVGNSSGVRSISVLVDGGQVAFEEQPCATGGCDFELEWEFLRENFSIGTHDVTTVVTDHASNQATHTFTVDLSATRTPDPSPSEVSSVNDGEAGDGDHGTGPVADCWTATHLAALAKRPRALDSRRLPSGATRAVASLQDGTYWATACSSTGRLKHAQRVAPVDTPDGTRRLVIEYAEPIAGRDREVLITHLHYGDPSDPTFRREWPQQKARLLAEVEPPTP